MSAYREDGQRWTAVQRRDRAADGSFVYAVRTTKIYCRPVCTARLARRANVEFFNLPQDAETAGYRACKRCKPQGGMMPEASATTRIRALIREEMQQQTSADRIDVSKTTSRLARKAQVSKWHFHRTFKEITGLTPSDFFAQHQSPSANQTLATSSHLVHMPNTAETSPRLVLTPGTSTTGVVDGDSYGNLVDWMSLYDELSIDLALLPETPLLLEDYIDDVGTQLFPLNYLDPIFETQCWTDGEII
ncbi:hypothetical protein KJ359_008455 [Pestalotiopsis sp. 9143b]|nr:hypothetical protein KJ359_008455 [Pestalotiopsis sp. 9143b]